jgi:hypothetical protein
MEFDKVLTENLAEAAHEIFSEELWAKGYSYGFATRDLNKEHSALRPYAELDEYEKDKNRNFVRDIPRKLLSISYDIRLSRIRETVIEFSESDIEKLARMEHERWTQEILASNAKCGQIRNKAKNSQKDLVPWDKLSEKAKDKDRALVRGIPKILAEAGYTIVKRAE